jgi:hypothetical protein
MERGYLVALLSIVATFTGLSHGFRSFEQWSAQRLHQVAVLRHSQCQASAAARAVAKLKTHLRPRYAQEAQLMAELNLPARMQSIVTEQNLGSVRCARIEAMQETELARRELQRAQREIKVQVEPLSLQVNLPADFEKQIQQSTVAATRMANQQIKLRILEDTLHRSIAQLPNPQ